METSSKAEHQNEVKNHKLEHSDKYESNPFLVSINGLMTLLKVNPVPSLLLAIFLMLVISGAVLFSIPLLLIPILGVLIFFGVIMLIVPVINGTYHSLAVSSLRGESRKTEEFISETFKKLPSLLGASILIGLIVFGGLLLFVIPGIIFGAWYSLTFFVMFDENLGAIDSMKRSKELVKGHVLEIISAVVAGTLLSGASTSGGGGLLSPAIAIAPLTGWYPQLKALKASGKEKPPVHWFNYVIVIFLGLSVVSMLLVFILAITIGIISGTSTKNQDTHKTRQEQRRDDIWESDRQYYLDDEPGVNL